MTGTSTTDAPSEEQRRRARPQLPVGPLGLLVITAIALAAAFGVARLVLELGREQPVSLQEMLDDTAAAPLVSNTEARIEVGAPAPNVRLEYLDGGVQDLAEVAGRGTPVVMNFWASTCVPCLAEMPAFEQVRAETEGELTFVGVNVADTQAAADEMVQRTGIRFRSARDPRSEIFAVYGGIALPRTVLIDGDGVVVATHTGELDEVTLTKLLDEHGLLPA